MQYPGLLRAPGDQTIGRRRQWSREEACFGPGRKARASRTEWRRCQQSAMPEWKRSRSRTLCLPRATHRIRRSMVPQIAAGQWPSSSTRIECTPWSSGNMVLLHQGRSDAPESESNDKRRNHSSPKQAHDHGLVIPVLIVFHRPNAFVTQPKVCHQVRLFQ